MRRMRAPEQPPAALAAASPRSLDVAAWASQRAPRSLRPLLTSAPPSAHPNRRAAPGAARMEALPTGCQLDLLLLYEVVQDDVMSMMFPVNSLRNMALLQARGGRGGWGRGTTTAWPSQARASTPSSPAGPPRAPRAQLACPRAPGRPQARTDMVAMVDVDLLVSNSLFEWLQDAKKCGRALPPFHPPHGRDAGGSAAPRRVPGRRRQSEREALWLAGRGRELPPRPASPPPPWHAPRSIQLLREGTLNKQLFVLPAFETAPQKNETAAHELADAASAMTKARLHGLVQKRLVYQFAQYLFWQARGGACLAGPLERGAGVGV
jgi:hypothetical protein